MLRRRNVMVVILNNANLDVVQYLVYKDADLQKRDKDGNLALQWMNHYK